MDTQKMENTRNTALPIAVIILNWNGKKLLEEFLPSVVENSSRDISRLIVADNGSTDDSVEYIRQNYGDTVETLCFSQNYGFAEGYNKAIAAVDNEYVVLLNSDVAVTPGWDTELLAFMEMHPDYAACQPKVLSYRNPSQFEYAGAAGGYIDKNGYPYCRGRLFGICETDSGQYDETADIFWATGACLMIRRNLYLAAGGLDAAFFAHMEEIDLCWRLQIPGHRIAAVPAACVYHLGGGSLPADNPKKTYLNFRNNLLMLHKNLPDKVRTGFLFRRRLLDTLAFVKFLLTLDFPNARALLKAHRDFAHMREQYTTHPEANLIGQVPGSRINLLSAFYLCRQTKFSELRNI